MKNTNIKRKDVSQKLKDIDKVGKVSLSIKVVIRRLLEIGRNVRSRLTCGQGCKRSKGVHMRLFRENKEVIIGL